MGDKKEIRFNVDTSSEQNRKLMTILSRYRPHERNRIILELLISYFVRGNPAMSPEPAEGSTVQEAAHNDHEQDFEPVRAELTKRIEELQERLDKVEAIVFGGSGQADKKEETTGRAPEDDDKTKNISGNGEASDVLEQISDDRKAASHSNIPPEVMAMITSLQNT